MQRLERERAIYVSTWHLAFTSGTGPGVGQSGFGLIPGFVYTEPYEELTPKSA